MDQKKFDKAVTLVFNLINVVSSAGTLAAGEILGSLTAAVSGALGDFVGRVMGAPEAEPEAAALKLKNVLPDPVRAEAARTVRSTERFFWPAVRKYEARIRSFVTDAFCDESFAIPARYAFNLPAIHATLDEAGFLGYLALAMTENEILGAMFQEIIECSDRHGDVINKLSHFLPELDTNLDTGEVRANPSPTEREEAGGA